MTRTQHHGSSGDDRNDVQADGARGYDEFCRALADDIDALDTESPISAARLVNDLSAKIEGALKRRVSFAALARAFERRGVPTTSDAIRVALGRKRKRRGERQPALEQDKGRHATPPAPPTAPPVEIDDGARANTFAADPEPARDTPSTPPRVEVGRHLD